MLNGRIKRTVKFMPFATFNASDYLLLMWITYCRIEPACGTEHLQMYME